MFRDVLIDYYKTISKHLVQQHKELHQRARKDIQILQVSLGVWFIIYDVTE